MKIFSKVLFLFFVCLAATASLSAGTIVVSNDEWMFSDSKIGVDNDTQFAKNVANFVAGGSGNILILSGNFGLTGSTLHTILTGEGYGVTTVATNPGSFAGYAAVFLAANVANDAGLATQLTSYVNGGGNVFLEGGTGCCGGAGGEAAYWNPFLNNFGLSFASVYNGVSGDINVSAFQSQGPSGPALFAGVNTVYMNNGNNVSISGGGPNVQIFSDGSQNGLFGVYSTTAVPEPSSLMFFGTGLAGLAGFARRRFGK